MTRGMRTDTLERVLHARAQKPLWLGPYFGELAVRANVTAATVAGVVGSHEQTVFRWFFGQSDIQPIWGIKIARLVALLAWMHNTGRVPLSGTPRERETQLQMYAHEYSDIVKGSVRLKLEA